MKVSVFLYVCPGGRKVEECRMKTNASVNSCIKIGSESVMKVSLSDVKFK